MKKSGFKLMALLILVFTSCNQPKEKKEEGVVDEKEKALNLEERGEYLVNVIGCADCHTPKKMTEKGPVPDMDRYMMGFDAYGSLPPVPENVPIGPWALFAGDLTAAVGPWGTSYAGNLTPHETGIGNWTLHQFRKAIKEGKYKGLDGSRPIMPPMPVEAYKNLEDIDVEAIFVYLKSLKPIENVVPAYTPPSS
ncbi:diheme cytochrome c-553 [Maribacter algicola]|uniref:Diheme cytochrome c-553 n=1 Tax=Maribacter algicola TaxID=2498892 RepID=A0A3R8S0P4_9FLAO|nr:diheme cytochrome c-553 [Maribacter algicola]RRQ49414.1 diheme cytochrome c-553 [Maribacter algicola]